LLCSRLLFLSDGKSIRDETGLASSTKGRNDSMTKQAMAVFLVTSGLALAQHDHDSMLHQRGDHEMGFAHDKTTHHFELHYDGGAIDVRADDVQDVASRDEIRSHFQHIVQMFSAGNFNVPMLVHAQKVPGTAAMARLKDQLHWEMQETPKGARITVTADNKASLTAVHEFLRFQIADHNTGDCPMVR
jgi:hypothetical protein